MCNNKRLWTDPKPFKVTLITNFFSNIMNFLVNDVVIALFIL